jgi:hypothetical protein
MPIFLSLFHKIERERKLPELFSEASITVIPKMDKATDTEEHTHTNYK